MTPGSALLDRAAQAIARSRNAIDTSRRFRTRSATNRELREMWQFVRSTCLQLDVLSKDIDRSDKALCDAIAEARSFEAQLRELALELRWPVER